MAKVIDSKGNTAELSENYFYLAYGGETIMN